MTPKEKNRLDGLFEAFSVVAEGRYVYLCDMQRDVSRWSEKAVEYFDLPDVYMENAGNIWAERIHPDDRENYLKSIREIFEGNSASHDMQYRARAKDNTYAVCTCRGVIIRDDDGKPLYFGGAIQNHGLMSYIDTVTGLRSLYGFFDDLKSIFWKHQKSTFLLMGVNNFSNINDIYGYTYGNSVLRSLANLIQKCFANRGAVYRMDGTKFAVISQVLDADGIIEIYKKIHEIVLHDYFVEDERITLSLNAGIVVADNFDITTETVYCCLKYAYSESKNKKLGEAVVFEDALSDDSRLYIEKLNVIRNSVAEDCKGFFLCYQPIINAETEELKGMEALIRWKSDDYGTVPPIQFIPVLEQDTLFPELGRWILRQAMEDGKLLLQKYPDFIMNVNLSYAQLEKSTFVSEVLQILEETGFPAKNLCLEITERCRILDMSILKNMFKSFREHGIRLALDDFGTGYCSLGLLREIPVDTVKIDREYVKDVEKSRSDQNTVQFISELAESFEAEVCVEGVETAEMRDFLKKYHVSSLQGYYYSKPIPMDEFIQKYIAD